jgi:membrane protease YdiL (CAAX protease family)
MANSISASTTPDSPQHSLVKSLGLHILPGVLTAVAFVVLKLGLHSSGYPPLLPFLLAVLLVDLPILLGLMLFEGRKRNGRWSLDGVVLYREKLSWVTFAPVFVGAFVVIYALMMVMTPISSLWTSTLFSWLPDWMFLDEQTQYRAYGKSVLTLVFTLQLVLTGVVLPWVEELYFRGYLMPRLSRYGKWAPLLGGLLFGLYHVWQLFSFPTVFLLGTALGYVVWWKQDIRMSVTLHVFANALTRLMFLMTALAM